jgi:hypothetical protein
MPKMIECEIIVLDNPDKASINSIIDALEGQQIWMDNVDKKGTQVSVIIKLTNVS